MIDHISELCGQTVSRETYLSLEKYGEILTRGNDQQNLISRSSLASLWERHILDSAQLARLEPAPGSSWADVGSGAGLPGIVIALLVAGPVLLIEPRRLRAEFLLQAVVDLGLSDRVAIAPFKAEKVVGQFDVITARAVASLDKLLGISTHLSTGKTRWVLPRGRGARSELAEARLRWHCDWESMPSRTDPDSEILVLHNVEARGKR